MMDNNISIESINREDQLYSEKVDKDLNNIHTNLKAPDKVDTKDPKGNVIGEDKTVTYFNDLTFAKKELVECLLDLLYIDNDDDRLAKAKVDGLLKYDNFIPNNYRCAGLANYYGKDVACDISLGESLSHILDTLSINKAVPITEFHVPNILWDAIKKSISEGKIGWSVMPGANVIRTRGIKRYNFLCNAGLPPYTACAMAGQLWFEDSWNTNTGINKQEVKGGGAPGTEGYAGAGEGWFGLTFWDAKWEVIKDIGIDLLRRAGLQIGNATTKEDAKREYNKPSERGKFKLYELGDEWWGRIFKSFVKTKVKYLYNILFRNNPSSEADMVEDIAASYLYKAGNYGGKCSKNHSRKPEDWVYDAITTTNTYMKSHVKRGFTKTPTDTFCAGIIVACMLASCMKKDKSNKELKDEFSSLNIPQKSSWTL